MTRHNGTHALAMRFILSAGLAFICHGAIAAPLDAGVPSPTPPPVQRVTRTDSPAELARHITALHTAPFKDTAGQPFRFDSLKGKIVWVNQWAHWCAPCVAEFRVMRQVQKQVGADKLEIVLVSRPRDWEKDQAYVKEHDLPWRQVVLDLPPGTSRDLYADVSMNPPEQTAIGTAFPMSTFLGRDGEGLRFDRHPVPVTQGGDPQNPHDVDILVRTLTEWAVRARG
ncbi:TlpA family protein disulfide reductase [Nitrospirillum bahiense]|uniref:Thioredoxin-like protein n=1 Tax=Nitrospirillum amazonense TaxID=28077 RepID=A0A560G4Q2_9PROT|nr:TlpA family protein disulfide reductase [Nitrospirillum amazonense]TWB28866.1 thioredoxin-like protein [Nitrospirillum amazonense]